MFFWHLKIGFVCVLWRFMGGFSSSSSFVRRTLITLDFVSCIYLSEPLVFVDLTGVEMFQLQMNIKIIVIDLCAP